MWKANQTSFKKGHATSEETRRKISESGKGRPGYWKGKKRPPVSQETRLRLSRSLKGRKDTEETRMKRIASARRGERSHFWKGGVTPINIAIRMSTEYRLWRRSVFERDKYMCVWCGQKGGRLNADHIKRFSDYPELRFAIDNGRTLCEPCHKKTDNFGRWKK